MKSKYYENMIADIPAEVETPQGMSSWEKFGFLVGIKKEYKKYLSDLFDNVALSFTAESDDIDFKQLDKQWNTKEWFLDEDKDNEEVNLKTDYIVILFPIVRAVFTAIPTLSYIEFLDGAYLTELSIDEIKKYQEDETVDDLETRCAKAIADKIIFHVKNKYNK